MIKNRSKTVWNALLKGKNKLKTNLLVAIKLFQKSRTILGIKRASLFRSRYCQINKYTNIHSHTVDYETPLNALHAKSVLARGLAQPPCLWGQLSMFGIRPQIDVYFISRHIFMKRQSKETISQIGIRLLRKR